MKIKLIFTPILLALAIASANVVHAGSYARDQVSTCTAINCQAQTIVGYFQPGEPFVTQVYAEEGECLRLAVTAQSVDTRIMAVYPNARYGWRDDNNGGNNRPLATILVTVAGYYTVVIGGEDYVPPGGGTVTLVYGRYADGTDNPNCD